MAGVFCPVSPGSVAVSACLELAPFYGWAALAPWVPHVSAQSPLVGICLSPLSGGDGLPLTTSGGPFDVSGGNCGSPRQAWEDPEAGLRELHQ